MENNNAPFVYGQKMIRTGKTIEGVVIKGGTYTAGTCYMCHKCKTWWVPILECPACESDNYNPDCPCGSKFVENHNSHYAGNADFFAPIQHQYTDISKEIADSFKQTEETPDKKIIPEKVNN